VYFSRYFLHKMNESNNLLKEEDSFFFHKRQYDSMIRKSKKLAKKLRIDFYHDPLFFNYSLKLKKPFCCMPWQIMLVDWDGDVYPCCGGEEWFKEKVKSGTYHFGNLLREHVDQCWNGLTYIDIRKTCRPVNKEILIPECADCHSTVYFKGPHLKHAHILKRLTGEI
jgi:MoaA/NifB/PqqE/SkfB family radical SAM enzyme